MWMIRLKIISIYMKCYDERRQEVRHEGITSNFLETMFRKLSSLLVEYDLLESTVPWTIRSVGGDTTDSFPPGYGHMPASASHFARTSDSFSNEVDIIL